MFYKSFISGNQGILQDPNFKLADILAKIVVCFL